MKRSLRLVCLLLCLSLLPATGMSGDHDKYLSQWLELLRTGNAHEKQFALRGLWFLRYEEYRKDPKVLDPIFAALKDKDPLVREAAAAYWTRMTGPLGLSMTKADIPAHLIPLLGDEVPAVRAEAAKAASSIKGYATQQLVDALIKSFHDKDIWVRVNAVYALGELGFRYWSVTATTNQERLYQTGSENVRKKEQRNDILPPPNKTSSAEVQKMKQGIITSSVGQAADETVRKRKLAGDVILSRDETPSGRELRKAPLKRLIESPIQTGGKRELLAESPHLNLSGAIAPMIELLGRSGDWREVFVKQEVVYALTKMHVQDEKAIAALLQQYEQAYLKKSIIKTLGILEALQAEKTLLKSLEDNNEGIRNVALEALLQLPVKWEERNRDKIIQDCRDKLNSPYPEVRTYAVKVLGKWDRKAGEVFILQALRDKSEKVVQAAIEELGNTESDKFLSDILPYFEHSSKKIRDASVRAFHQLALRTTNERVYAERKGTARIILKIDDGLPRENEHLLHRTASGMLVSKLAKGDTPGKISALSIIDEFEDERIEPQLLRLLDDKVPDIRNRASYLLQEYGTEQSVPGLIKALKTSDRTLKLNVILALDVIGDRRAKEPLLDLLKDKDATVRTSALHALKKYDDPEVADAALSLIPNEKSESARASATALMRKKKDSRALDLMLNELNEYWGPSEFTTNEFSGSHSSKRFSEALTQDGLEGGQGSTASLNRLLARPDLYKKLKELYVKKLKEDYDKKLTEDYDEKMKQVRSTQTISKRIETLEQRYNKSRNDTDLRILNRAALEAVYPGVCPKRYPEKAGRVDQIMSAISYLGEIGDSRAVKPILEILENEMEKGCGKDDHYKVPIVSALGKLNDQRPVGAFIQLLKCKDTSNALKEEILTALGSLKARDAVPILRDMLRDARIGTGVRVVRSLGEIGDPQALDDLKAKLYQDSSLRRDIEKALIQIGGEKSGLILVEHMAPSSPFPDDATNLEFIQSLDRVSSIKLLLKFSAKVGRTDSRIAKVVEILKAYRAPSMMETIGNIDKADDWEVKAGYILILGEFRDAAYLVSLKRYLTDADPRIRRIAKDSIEVIESNAAWQKKNEKNPLQNADTLRPGEDAGSKSVGIKLSFLLSQSMVINGQYIYLGGAAYRRSNHPAFASEWRLEKRSVADCVLDSKFGDHGAIKNDVIGRITGLAADSEYIYACGFDEEETGFQRFRWRIEKRRLLDGSLVSEFGSGGTIRQESKSKQDNLLPSAIASIGDQIIIAGHQSQNLPKYMTKGRVEKRMKNDGMLASEFGTQGVLMIDASEISSIAVDTSYIYIAAKDYSLGNSDSRWHFEKRSLKDGSLISSFGVDGIVTENPSPSNDQITMISIDGGYLYAVGYNMGPGKTFEWRIEKRKTSNGSLVAAFGKDGVITSKRGPGYNSAVAIAIDRSVPSMMYIVGRQAVGNDRNQQWRIEKRRILDGSLTEDFGNEGVMTYNPSDRSEGAQGVAVSDEFLYVVGDDLSKQQPNSDVGGMQQLLKIKK